MPKFEDDFYGHIADSDWLSVGRMVERPNDPVDSLFPDEKTDNLIARWETIAADYQLPMMAHFHGFDTEANTTFRVPIDSHNVEKGLIKEKINQSERLQALINRGVVRDQQLYDYVLNDGFHLANDVITRTKVAKNELMATGKVTIDENNLNLTVDYGVPDKNVDIKLEVNDDADVPAQFQKIVDYALENGVPITGIVTSRKMLTKLRMNKSFQIIIGGVYRQGAIIPQADFLAFLASEYGITDVRLQDGVYGYDHKIGKDNRPIILKKRYFPADKITFYGTPNTVTRMGAGLWGDPPEVLARRFTNAAASGESPYVYITQWAEDDPAVTWTKASALFMPVLFDPNSLYIAKVVDKK